MGTLAGSGGTITGFGSLIVGENNANSTFSGTIQSNGSLSKAGTGVLTLEGAAPIQGGIQVTGGTLRSTLSNLDNSTQRLNVHLAHPGTTFEFAHPGTNNQQHYGAIGGSGSVVKSGGGSRTLFGDNTYTGSTTISGGTLQAGSNTAFGNNSLVTVSSGATLDVNGFGVAIGSLTGSGTVNLGNGTLTLGGDNADATFSGTIGGGNLVKEGTGTHIFSGVNQIGGTTTIRNGTLKFDSAMTGNGQTVRIENSGELWANATINRAIHGSGPSSHIRIGASGISLGHSASDVGFVHQGMFSVGSHSVTLVSNGTPQLGSYTSLTGGTLTSANGVVLGSGSTLTGFGTVNAKIAGATGSNIVAGTAGTFTLGANVVGGFVHNGELNTKTTTVTLLSTNRATLGSVTTLGSGGTAGTLNVSNGAFVDFGRAIQGHGTINSTNTLAKAMVINGDVYGTSSTERITFTGYVKGVGTFENTTFNGTFAPGLSPAIVNTNNATFGSGATLEVELGGTTPGSQHDKLIDSGLLTLGGILKLVFINGYTPTGTETFDILDWNTRSGTFSGIDLSGAAAPTGFEWNTSKLYVNGQISFQPVPEPATVLAVGAAGLGLVGWVRRRRKAGREVVSA